MYLYFRRKLSVLFLYLMGINFHKYTKLVASINRLDEFDRLRYIESYLKYEPITNYQGVKIDSIDSLNACMSMTKNSLLNVHGKKLGIFKRKTSGTTGRPTTIYLKKDELSRLVGVRNYCYEKYGFSVGDREARLWKRQDDRLKGKLVNLILNRKIFHPVGKKTVSEIKKLSDWRPCYIYGYSSLVFEAAKVSEKNNIKFDSVKAVVCTAENILPAQKDYISKVFNAPVVEEYGMTEFDIIGFECKSGHLHIVNPWLIIELENDKALITDISRNLQPLVKYTVSDFIKLGLENCHELGRRSVISKVEGRSSNRFALSNSKRKFHASIFSTIFNEYMERYMDSFDFHVSQSEPGLFCVDLSTSPKRGTLHLEKFVTRKMLEIENLLVEVIVSVKNDLGNKKRSYFTQNLDLSDLS